MKKNLYSFLLAAFLATASQFAFADITTGLRIHYSFDQVDSTDATPKVPYINDLSPNNLDGIVQGKVALVNSYSATGKALSMVDTVNLVKAPANMFEGVSDFTVALWINQNENIKWARFFDFGSNQDHYMFLCTDGDVGDYLRFEFDYDINPANGNDDGMLKYLKATRKLTVGKWSHVVITGQYNITAEDTTSTIKIYINGMLSATSDQFVIAPYMLGNNLTHPYFGDSQWPDPPVKSNIDDFRLYTRALSEADIEELSGVSAAQKTAWSHLVIPEASRTNMEYGTELTLPTLFEGFKVTWTTSDSTVIKNDGKPQHSEFSITDAILTAAVSPAGMDYPMTEKDYFVSVYPTGEIIDIVAKFKFLSKNIIRRNDSVLVASEGQVAFNAFTKGGSQILPIGDESPTGKEGVNFFNVYVSDNTATSTVKQELNLGTKVGQYLYKLRDHSISIFYRRDTSIDKGNWLSQGQQLWAFSNTEDLGGTNKGWGAMYFEPNDCNVSILEGVSERSKYKSSATPYNALMYGTGVKVNNSLDNTGLTPLGNTWHNITYTQIAGIGYLFVDAVQVASSPMPAPKEQLRKNAAVATFTGTPYNVLGNAPFTNRVSAKNTMLWGFELRSSGVPIDQVNTEFSILTNISRLNTAIQNTTYDVVAYLNLLPTLAETRKTLAIGYLKPIHQQLTDLYNQAKIDSANRTSTAASVKALTDSIAKYKTYSTDWVNMGKKLQTFGPYIALNYPGLAVLQSKIQMAQEAYNAFEVETALFTFLDEAVLEYQKSQVATSSKPANYTFMVKNPGFEEGDGGTKDPKSINGNLTLPKGWTVFYDCDGTSYSKAGYATADNPIEGKQDFEIWSSGNATYVNKTDIYQVTSEPLAAGWYVLSGTIRALPATRGGQHMYAYSLVDSIRLKSDTLEADVPGLGWSGGYGWGPVTAHKKVFIKFKSTGAKYRIGFTADTAQYKMDDVKLAYFGTSDNEPVLGDVTSYIKNAGFELANRTTELDGFDATTNITADAGNVFAPLDWNVLATATGPKNNASISVMATGASEGANYYRMKADTLTSVKLTQVIYAPTTGLYKLNAYVRADSACRSDARLFAKVGRRYEEGKKLMTAVDTSLTFTGWKKMEYTFRAAITDQIDLGLISSGNVEVDNFKLENYSNVAVGIKGQPTVGSSSFNVYAKDGIIYISGLTASDRVSVYDIAGRQISVKNASQIKVSKGMYMIKINNDVIKQLVK